MAQLLLVSRPHALLFGLMQHASTRNFVSQIMKKTRQSNFDVLLIVHLSIILVTDQPNAPILVL